MSRKYNKTSPYWEQRKAGFATTAQQQMTEPRVEPVPFPEIEAYANDAGGSGPQSSAGVRGTQVNNGLVNPSAFQNLKSLPLPYVGYNGTRSGYGFYGGNGFSGGYIGVSTAIELCGRAWAGVSTCRNAIEVAVEFSNQPLWIKCKNKTVKKFFQEWFGAIGINRLKEEFFREYYRSGNIFLLLFEGKFGPKYFQNFQTTFGMKENRIPIRYELLNPTNVFVPVGLVANYTYVRLLSTYEITRLQNPLTPQDKQVFNDLPETAKTQIRNYNAANPMGIYIPLDAKRLRFAFYKKQSYEPLAVPMIWPVLPDVEWKLMLKKMDKALLQNVERIILLVTNGEGANKDNGGRGINQKNLINLQSLLMNQTLNRVVVADYTTKAQFIQPDLKDLGPEKYQVVNDDIREGLQSILTGDDKFANAQIKAKIFVRRLEEGQGVFLDDFLNIEISKVCDIMGFRDKPLVGFRKINLQDETVMARIYAQLAQLGVLTAKQTVDAIDTNVLPDEDEMDEGQTEYMKDRDAGKYLPLVGGTQESDDGGAGGGSPVGGGGRPAGSKAPKSSKSPGPIGTSKGAENPRVSMAAMIEALAQKSELEQNVEKELKKVYKIESDLTDPQKDVAASLSFAIMAGQSRDKWTKVATARKAVKSPPKVGEAILGEIDQIRQKYDLRSAFEAIVVKEALVPEEAKAD